MNSPDTNSGAPAHILDVLSAKLAQIDRSEVEPDALRALVRGALRAIGDAGYIEDDDPVVAELMRLDDILPQGC